MKGGLVRDLMAQAMLESLLRSISKTSWQDANRIGKTTIAMRALHMCVSFSYNIVFWGTMSIHCSFLVPHHALPVTRHGIVPFRARLLRGHFHAFSCACTSRR